MFTTIAEILRCQLIAIDLELCFGIFVDVPGKSSNLFGGLTFSRSRGSSPPPYLMFTPLDSLKIILRRYFHYWRTPIVQSKLGFTEQ